ncbi:hypothetical protein [Agarilytica rhodophyticola]|uniref:hypothetical protein n=1 Tax=Agarilytica rhodophyticola TaxID=1737490 RepID=UPI000B344A83|nr:hypothetical protein [Agarilytica rhodophyticola]
MKIATFGLIPLLIILVGCNASMSARESANYSTEKSLAQIQAVHNKLSIGMTKQEVDALLGNPDYSPEDGKYYYASSEKLYLSSEEKELSVGLVIEYRNKDGSVSESLQNFWVGALKDYQHMLSDR